MYKWKDNNLRKLVLFQASAMK